MSTSHFVVTAGLALGLLSTACDSDPEALIRQCYRPCGGGLDMCLTPCPKLAPAPPPKPQDPEEQPDCKNPDWPC